MTLNVARCVGDSPDPLHVASHSRLGCGRGRALPVAYIPTFEGIEPVYRTGKARVGPPSRTIAVGGRLRGQVLLPKLASRWARVYVGSYLPADAVANGLGMDAQKRRP
jgi:hypothetical protein